MSLINRISREFNNVEILETYEVNKNGKTKQLFKAFVREPGFTECITVMGNTVEKGKTYTLNVQCTAFKDSLYFRLDKATETGSAAPAGKGKGF